MQLGSDYCVRDKGAELWRQCQLGIVICRSLFLEREELQVAADGPSLSSIHIKMRMTKDSVLRSVDHTK